MALLFCDGFDARDYTAKWASGGAYGTYHGVTSSTRFGAGSAYYLTSSLGGSYIQKSFISTPTVIVGFAIKIISLGSSDTPITILSGSWPAIQIVLNPAGRVRLMNNARTFFDFDGLGVDKWHYLEVMAYIHETNGSVAARLNGVNKGSYSGDTRPTQGSTGFSNVLIGASDYLNQSTCAFDDLYVCDDTGTTNNTFLGDIRVQTLLPTAAGASTQFTPTSGASYTMVNDVPDVTTSYNASSTVGQRDTFAMGDIGTQYTVLGTQNNIHAWKSDAGTGNVKIVTRSGGTDYYSPSLALGTSMASYSEVREVNPATSAQWTYTDINGLETGYEVA